MWMTTSALKKGIPLVYISPFLKHEKSDKLKWSSRRVVCIPVVICALACSISDCFPVSQTRNMRHTCAAELHCCRECFDGASKVFCKVAPGISVHK